MNDDRQPAAMPGFRSVGVGSLVTKNCLPCGKWKLTTGSTGSGIRWRCAECSKPKVKA